MNPVRIIFSYSILIIFLFASGMTVQAQNTGKSQLVTFENTWNSPYVPDPEYSHHFVNDEGNHLYLYTKSAFAYFRCKDPKAVLSKAHDIGANVIRVCLEGTPFYNKLRLDMWPWGGTRKNPNWKIFNEAYWSMVEQRVRLAGENDIGLNIILYYTLKPSVQDVEVQRKYWEYVLRRLGKYANVFSWEIMYTDNIHKDFIDIAGTYFKTHDPYHRPVFSTGPGSDDAFMPDKPWMDIAVVQTPTGSQPQYGLDDWYLAVARNVYNHGKPAFNAQPGREMVDENDDPIFRRKQGWLWCMTGAFWTWHSYDGCDGINEINYYSPGWQYSKPVTEFFNSVPFWTMTPNFTACRAQDPELITQSLATSDRKTVLFYGCYQKQDVFARGKKMSLRLPAGSYDLSFFRPGDLKKIKSIDIQASGVNNLLEIDLPDFKDDILIMISKN